MIRKFQTLQHLFCFCSKGFQFIPAVFRFAVFHHFHFMELVLTDKAAGIFAGRTCLFAEAGSEGGEVDRKHIAIQDFTGEIVGQRYFSSWSHIHVFPFHLVHIFGKLRQLAGALHGFAINDIRRNHFGIVIFLRVEIQHEIVYRSFQTGSAGKVEIETGTGYLAGSFSIQNPQFITQFVVSFNGEIEFRNFAPAADFRIFAVILAYRNGFVSHVWNMKEQLIQCTFHFSQFLVNSTDLPAYFSHGSNSIRSIFPIFLCLGNFLGFCILLTLQRFRFLQKFPSLSVQFQNLIQVKGIMTVHQILLNLVSVFTNKFDV